MSFLKKVSAANNSLENTVISMMNSVDFIRALPNLVSAAESAILVGHKQGKPNMVKFNQLCIAYFEAMHKKDLPLAVKAAADLVKSGHGAMFGLA